MRLLLLLFFLPALAIGQSRTITGNVVDEETGEPLINVTILVQHRCGLNDTLVRSCYYTNVNGTFSFAINWPPQRIIKRWSPPPRIITLRFMYIGYKARTVTIDEFRDSTTIALGLVAVESYSTTFDLGLVALESFPYI